MHSRSLIAFLLTVMAAGHALAEELPIARPGFPPGSPVKPALDAWRSGWPVSATELAGPLAEKGDADALYLLGLVKESAQPARLSRGQAMDYFYRRAEMAGSREAGLRRLLILLGSNLSADRTAGKDAFDKALATGDPLAARIWGEACLRGFASAEGKADLKTAIESWKKSADAGDMPSLTLLGRLYEGRFGFPEATDRKLASECYRKAAGLGDEEAMLLLGEALLKENDVTQGRELLRQAIGKGVAEGDVVLGDYEQRVRKDADEAEALYREGANAGNAACMRRLALQLLEDDKTRAEGLQWLGKAAAAGNAGAAADYGQRLSKDSPAAALPYLLQAANEGSPQAQYAAGLLYLDGRLGYRDPASAVAWLTEAMKSGDAQIQYKLGTLHESGTGCPINYANAGVLYTMACNKGHAAAAGRIAFLASEGLGMRPDPVQACAYATLAVERGDESSKALLARLSASMSPARKQEVAEALKKLTAAPAAPGDAQNSTSGTAPVRATAPGHEGR